jgi:hypothetical protein
LARIRSRGFALVIEPDDGQRWRIVAKLQAGKHATLRFDVLDGSSTRASRTARVDSHGFVTSVRDGRPSRLPPSYAKASEGMLTLTSRPQAVNRHEQLSPTPSAASRLRRCALSATSRSIRLDGVRSACSSR